MEASETIPEIGRNIAGNIYNNTTPDNNAKGVQTAGAYKISPFPISGRAHRKNEREPEPYSLVSASDHEQVLSF